MIQKFTKKGIGQIWLIVIALLIIGAMRFYNVVGWFFSIVTVMAIICLAIWYYNKKQKEKREYLTKKYKKKDIVERIMYGEFWEGQSAKQLRDSLGSPKEIDETVLKRKKREVWKYNQDGYNRFRLRISLDNDVVVGWKQR
ncbi:DUF2845 domain-containing protein [Candidatus Woesearchaeota archaeon CG10_big_fil_rev_8_21_14_0_10_37_12]|nr:MAG: DUF2845 domain-containing protein [Candidatus Woesearchaeota archaeon CG10_big_fil_rev_8_21_14_0_10_37_12]